MGFAALNQFQMVKSLESRREESRVLYSSGHPGGRIYNYDTPGAWGQANHTKMEN